MKFEKLGKSPYVKLADHKSGDILVNGDKLDRVEIADENAMFPGKKTYVFKSDEGEETKLSGTGLLDAIMEEAEIGQYFQITYKGKKKVKNGMAHQFDVAVGTED